MELLTRMIRYDFAVDKVVRTPRPHHRRQARYLEGQNWETQQHLDC